MASHKFQRTRRIEVAGAAAVMEIAGTNGRPWRRAGLSVQIDPEDGCDVREADGTITLSNGTANITMPCGVPIAVSVREGGKASGRAVLSQISCDTTSTIEGLQLLPPPSAPQEGAGWRSAAASLLVIGAFALLMYVIGFHFGVAVSDALIAGAAGGLVFRGRARLNVLISLLAFAVTALGTEAIHALARSSVPGEAGVMFPTLGSVLRPIAFFFGGLVSGFAARGVAEKFMPEHTW